MLRMVKGLDPARFEKSQLTLDQNEKMGLDTMPKTMLEALELINEFKVKFKLTPHPACKGLVELSKRYSLRQS